MAAWRRASQRNGLASRDWEVHPQEIALAWGAPDGIGQNLDSSRQRCYPDCMAESCSDSACLSYSAKGIPAGRPSTGWIQARGLAIVFAILALGSLSHAQWTPPPGGGDPHIEDETVGEMLDPILVASAIGILLETGDPNASAIWIAWNSQAVNIHVFKGAEFGEYDGVADSNTIAIHEDIKDPEYLAILLYHEWHHVKQYNGSPDTEGEAELSDPCLEYSAYRAHYLFMCSLMSLQKAQNDDGILVERPFPCSALRYSELSSRWHDCVNANMGGSPAIPPIPPSCGLLYCAK